MFKEIENGTLIKIRDNSFGFTYNVYVPPLGKGYHVVTGEIVDVEMVSRSDDPEEQHWDRGLFPIPDYYKKRRKEEERNQSLNKFYIDPELEAFRQKEWHRRLCGVWFLNNGVWVYLTGVHWLMLARWKYQGKWLDYRKPDRDSFYVVQYCIDDPCCLGLNEIMNRKSLKTGRAGVVLYDRTSRYSYHHGGIQSKTDDDAFEMFKKALVQPWRTLPHYFRPLYDTMKGDDPNEGLFFFRTARRGASALLEPDDVEEPLESFVDYKASEEKAYDGPELHTYVSDETSKTIKSVSIIERQNVTRYASEIGGEFYSYAEGQKVKNFHYYTTTVEVDIEKGEEEHPEFQELTAMSNPLDKDGNGRTMSGLYTYFRPAHHSLMFDKFGDPKIEEATIHLMNTRDKLEQEGYSRKLSSFKRKQPMTFAEAFSIDGTNALYNPELLNLQLENIRWRNDLTEKGNLRWHKGYRFLIPKIDENGIEKLVPNIIEWVADQKGKFEKLVGWTPKGGNSVYEMNGAYFPNNNQTNRIGIDPFKYDKTKDKRRSNCAAFNYQLADELYPDKFDDMFTLKYSHREESTRLANEDILMMLWWCGCQGLFERNVNHWKDYFIANNCHGFLTYLPNEEEPGVYTDPSGKMTQLYCNYTESYINEHIKKVFFKSLIDQETGWLGFKVEETSKFDEPMAAGITLVAVKGKKYKKQNEVRTNIESLFSPKYAV